MFSSYPTKLLQSSMNRSESDLRNCKESPGKKGSTAQIFFRAFQLLQLRRSLSLLSFITRNHQTRLIWRVSPSSRGRDNTKLNSVTYTVNEYGVEFLFTGKNISGYHNRLLFYFSQFFVFTAHTLPLTPEAHFCVHCSKRSDADAATSGSNR